MQTQDGEYVAFKPEYVFSLAAGFQVAFTSSDLAPAPLILPLFISSCREFDQVFAKAAAYDENLAFLRTMLQALHRCEDHAQV